MQRKQEDAGVESRRKMVKLRTEAKGWSREREEHGEVENGRNGEVEKRRKSVKLRPGGKW